MESNYSIRLYSEMTANDAVGTNSIEHENLKCHLFWYNF